MDKPLSYEEIAAHIERYAVDHTPVMYTIVQPRYYFMSNEGIVEWSVNQDMTSWNIETPTE